MHIDHRQELLLHRRWQVQAPRVQSLEQDRHAVGASATVLEQGPR